MKISDLLETRHKPNILAYGPSMCGKTRFITTLRKVYTGPCYIFNFDTEENLIPIMLTPGMGEVEYDQYDHPAGYDQLIKKIVELKKAAAESYRTDGKPFPYDLICLENGNVLHKTIMDTLLILAGREDKAQIQDWGLAADRVKKRLKEIIDLPCPVYVTFHQQIEKEEIYGRAVGRILIPGKFLPDEIPPMFNMFLHFVAESKGGKLEYKVQCGSDPLWPAGDKTGSLDVFEEPDFSKMAEKIGRRLAVARLAAKTTPKEGA